MHTYDYLIIGAGPAGLQMAYFLERAGCDYVVLEANGTAGSFFIEQPRHRMLLSINKRFNFYPEPDFNLRHDWNSLLTEGYEHRFTEYADALYPDAGALVRYLEDFAERYALRIEYGTRVSRISRSTDGFALEDAEGGHWSARRLLVGTGAVRPDIPEDIEGIELAEGYEDHDIEPSGYENQRVLILGRGNSAFEVANHLAGHAAVIHLSLAHAYVKHAWATHYVGDLRAINNTILDMYQLKSMHATPGFVVRRIEPRAAGGFTVTIEHPMAHWSPPGVVQAKMVYDRVIRCTGWRFVEPALFDADIRPEVCPKAKYPVLDASWQSTTPDVYYIGTAMGGRDHTAASSFIHGFRYNIRTLFHLLRERYDGVPLARTTYPLRDAADLEALTQALVKRLSTTSALYQMFSVLGDVLLFGDGEVHVFEELPVQWALARPEFAGAELAVMTLEYGFENYPEGAVPNDFIHFPLSPDCAAFLHGVIRHWSGGECRSVQRMDESFTIRYDVSLSDDFDPAPTVALLARALDAIAGVTDGTLPVPNYRMAFRPWSADEPYRDIGHVECTQTGGTAIYLGEGQTVVPGR